LLGASQAAFSALFGNKNPRRYLRKVCLSKQYREPVLLRSGQKQATPNMVLEQRTEENEIS